MSDENVEEASKLIPGQLEEGEEKEVQVDPRVFVCSFPKSGTHLVEQLVQTFVTPMPADKPWAGTFKGHSWTSQWIGTKPTVRRIGYIRDGTYAKGHLGYKPEIENFLFGIGAATIFVYRDPRDVAVSLTHHILNGQTHDINEVYQDMGFDATLLAVIQGLGVYSGVMERWEHYAPWLDVEWVFSVKFEDLIGEGKREVLSKMVRYIVGHSANVRGYDATIPESVLEEAVDKMIINSSQKEKSPTFRKGKSGGWREEFKMGHCVAFKDSDENDWLTKLGYEEDEDWQSEPEKKLVEDIKHKKLIEEEYPRFPNRESETEWWERIHTKQEKESQEEYEERMEFLKEHDLDYIDWI